MATERPSRFLLLMLGLPVLAQAGTLAVCLWVDPFDVYHLAPVREGFNANKPHQQFHERIQRAAAVSREKPDGLVMGTSRAQVGLDPKAPGLVAAAPRGLNVAFSDGSPYEARRMLEHAQALGPVKVAVFGADYLSFVGDGKHAPDWLEDRLAVKKDGRPNRVYQWADLPAAGLSFDALRYAVRTARQQAQPSYFFEDGRRRPDSMERRIVEQGGMRATFQWSERDYADSYVCADTHRLPAHLEDFDRLLADAKASGTRLVVLKSPSHVRSLALLDVVGLWPEYERFTREVFGRALVQGAEVWEFAGADPRTTAEAVPPAGDATSRLRWYWESSHYKKELGDVALARAFGAPVPEGLEGWGEAVTPATLEASLARVTQELRDWEAAHPDELAELRQAVADAKAQHVCRRRAR